MKPKEIATKFTPLKNLLLRFDVLIFIFLAATMFAFMTLQIASYSNAEPTADQVDEKRDSLKTVKLDESAVSKLKLLEDKNISIESLFDNGRANPFE
jgi:hypothetical protein